MLFLHSETQDEELHKQLHLKVYGNSYDEHTIINRKYNITAAQQEKICIYTQKWLKQMKDNCEPGMFFTVCCYLF